MLAPDSRRPSGNARVSQPAVRRCMLPTFGGGLAASRAIAYDESCASESACKADVERSQLPEAERALWSPSIWFRSASFRPRIASKRSSLIEVIGTAHCMGASPKNACTGCARRLSLANFFSALADSSKKVPDRSRPARHFPETGVVPEAGAESFGMDDFRENLRDALFRKLGLCGFDTVKLDRST
eukprot:6005865-Prymnesium_polylepis.1